MTHTGSAVLGAGLGGARPVDVGSVGQRGSAADVPAQCVAAFPDRDGDVN
jgi:hypothetical protein